MTFRLPIVLVTAVEALRNDLGQNDEATNHLMGLRQLYTHSNSAAAERAAKIMRGEIPPQTDEESPNTHFRAEHDDPNKILNALSLVERAAQLVSASHPVDVEAMSEHIQKISDSISNIDTDATPTIPPMTNSNTDTKPEVSSLMDKAQVESKPREMKQADGVADPSRVRNMQEMSEKMVEMVNMATQSDSMWKLWTSMANQTGLFGDFVHEGADLTGEDTGRLRVENDALVSNLMALRQEETSASQQLQKTSGELKTIQSKMDSEVQKLALENQRYHELVEHLEGQSSQLAEGSQQVQQKKANLLQDIQTEKASVEHMKTDIASVQQSNERLSIDNQRMRSETEQFAEEVSSLQKKTAMVDEMQQAIADATMKIDDLSKKNQALRLVQARLKKEASEITQAQEASRVNFEDLSRQNEELASENGALRSSLQRLKTDTNLLQQRNGALENTLDGFQGSLRSMANVGSAANIASFAKSNEAVAHQPRFRGSAALTEQ